MFGSDDKILAHLRTEPLATVSIPGGTRLWRVHEEDCVIDAEQYQDIEPPPHEVIYWSEAGRFGSASCRVLYLGKSREGAFLETMCSDPAFGITVSAERLASYACSAIDTPAALELVNLTNDALLKNHLDSNVFSSTGPDDAHRRTYRYARSVAVAVHENPNDYDGVLYHSRVNPEFTNVALFFRNEKFSKRLQSRIELATKTLIEEEWVFEMQADGFISIQIMQ